MANKFLAVISGGLDSAVALAMRLKETPLDTEIHTITFSYGQTHLQEIESAKEIAKHYNVKRHEIIDLLGLGPRVFSRGSIVQGSKTTTDFPMGIPNSYIPARNFVFLSLAAAYAISNDIQDIICGIHATDAPYPDCQREALEPFILSLYYGTSNNISLEVPLLDMSKEKVVRMGHALGVPFEKTLTCYFPRVGGKPCKKCLACETRIKAFKKAGVEDPCYD